MDTNTEGMLVASTCMLHALIHTLKDKGLISASELGAITSDALAYLGGLSPDLMSSDARAFAGDVLKGFDGLNRDGPKQDR